MARDLFFRSPRVAGHNENEAVVSTMVLYLAHALNAMDGTAVGTTQQLIDDEQRWESTAHLKCMYQQSQTLSAYSVQAIQAGCMTDQLDSPSTITN